MDRRRGLYSVIAAFVVCRAAYALAGLRMDDSALHPANVFQVQWQLLPLNLLRHDLLRSVWNLHSQPPLYNLLCGALLHLPAGARGPVATVLFVGLGLALAVCGYLLLGEVGIPTWPAVLVTVVVVVDPATALYEEWLSWSYPSAVALTAGAWALIRAARRGSPAWAGTATALFAVVVLIDTTFQWPWLVAVTVPLLWVAGRGRRAVTAAAMAVPLVLVAGWYVKGAVQFGTAATSSWLGMNLYQTTVGGAPTAEVDRLIGSRTLSPLAAVPPFGSVADYTPRFAAARPTGIPALDQRTGPQGVPNFNNSAYLPVSARYLADDLAYLRVQPGRYAAAVTRSARLWSVPADQYLRTGSDGHCLSGWSRLYDTTVLLDARPAAPALDLAALTAGSAPGPARVSWTVVALTLVDLLAAPVALWRNRADRAWLVGIGAMWLTVLYSFTVTCATEVAENMRFRFELGIIPVALAAASLVQLWTKSRISR